jgi:folylpolyglutamate synthase/dihydropteroate synthase
MVEYFQAGAGSTEKIDEVWLSLSTRPLPEAKAALEVLLAGISLSPVWSFCLFNHAKAMSASELSQPPLAGLVKQLTGSESPFDLASLIKGLESKGAAPRTLLVTGSYYFISEVQKSLFAL